MALGSRRNRYQPMQTTVAPTQTAQPMPQYGLAGAENAILQGGIGSLDQLYQTSQGVGGLYDEAQQQVGDVQGQVSNLFGQGIDALSPYQESGAGATELQAALSGAMGPQAQQQAMQQYQTSPFYNQAREVSERAITRNAAATGNLGSGNTLDQLFQNAAGMFLQDYNTRFNQLGQLSQQGLSASSTAAGLRGQEAGIQSNLGQFGASLPTQEAGLQAQLGSQAAQIPSNIGSQIGGYRMQAGRDIASAGQQTTSALANLINQQGAGQSDIVGNYANNINALYQQAAQGDANAQEQLAGLLANMSVQQGSQVAGLPVTNVTPPSMLGQVGRLASGIGAMLPYTQSQTTPETPAATPASRWVQPAYGY